MEPTMEMDHVQMGACDLLQLQQLLVPCVLRYGVCVCVSVCVGLWVFVCIYGCVCVCVWLCVCVNSTSWISKIALREDY